MNLASYVKNWRAPDPFEDALRAVGERMTVLADGMSAICDAIMAQGRKATVNEALGKIKNQRRLSFK